MPDARSSSTPAKRQPRRRRRRQRIHRRHARACAVRVSRARGSSIARITASGTRTTAASMTCDARYVLFLNPDTEISRARSASLFERWTRAGGRPRGRAAGDAPTATSSRRSAASQRAARSLVEALALGAVAVRARLARRARARPGRSTTREVDLRLDLGVVHARAPGGARERRAARRAVLHLLGGDRSLPADQAGRLGNRPSARITIVHHAGKAGWKPKVYAQEAFARRQYMRKHYSLPRRAGGTAALALGLRPACHVGGAQSRAQPCGLACARRRWRRCSAALGLRTANRRRSRSASQAPLTGPRISDS